MGGNFLHKSISLLLKRQTNILTAAFVIMSTVILSQILGLVRQRLLVAIFGASDTLGVYLASTRLPEFIFQLIIAGALSSAFIPVFSEFLAKGKTEEANKMASTLLTIGLTIFIFLAIILFAFAPFFLQVLNIGSGYSVLDMQLMADLMRIILFGQLLFIIGTFFTALLQSHHHFFVPGIAAATYNLGIIIGIVALSPFIGIYGVAVGVIIGSLIFILVQIPLVLKLGFSFRPRISLSVPGISEVTKLMWPRTISIAIFQLGSLVIVALISFLANPGRYYVIFDYAQTLAFAPTILFGQTIAQAAFPILAKERERLDEFKATMTTSINQMLYLVLPFTAIFIVLRIPIVRLIYGAGQFDWTATVLTGKTLSFFAISIFAQALIYLVSRGFYALHDTKTPLIVGGISTILMVGLGYLFIIPYQMGIESLALAYSIASIVNLFISLVLLDRKTGGFNKTALILPFIKILTATFFTGLALYIPIKLLDQLVFDTTRTINLLMLTGISSLAGLFLYLFLTWFFDVKEAMTYIHLFKKIGNWKEILGKQPEVLETPRMNP